MLSRRDFMTTAAITTATTTLFEAARAAPARQPLRALPRVRTLYARPHESGGLRLFSDGAPEPRALVREDVLDRAFGRGAARLLQQPDHWRMIDEGWFAGDDLYTPEDPSSMEYWIWQANHHPECEAHDLLCDLFRAGLSVPWGSVPELGLALGEHPCTPRFATATLHHPAALPRLARQVAEMTTWVIVDPEPRRA